MLMFSGDNSGDVDRTGLFGSLRFQATEQASGAVDLSLGVANPTALVVIFVALCAVILLFQLILPVLMKRRQELLEEERALATKGLPHS
ncbi:hypothetical protein ACNHYB_10345 [Isoptericola jiangsuensis]|uniref:hypothetical protein n=1 Tax=Isoptericola jiangsuensis TaxID=548579 RepID=UPI003AAE2AB1